MIKLLLQNIGDWFYITLRQLGLKKCDQHGWTYILDDTEQDHITCAFCWKLVFPSDSEFEEVKNKIIMWRWGEFCHSASWTKDTEKELREIVKRNLNKKENHV